MLDIFILKNCPYCQKVMEHLEHLQFRYHKFDTLNNDNALRLLSIGGKDQVPFLYNENTNEKIYESEEIIKYINSLDRKTYEK